MINMKNITNIKLVNLTPHELTIYDANNVVLRIPPSGQVARVTTREKIIGSVNGVPLVTTEYSAVEGLPDPQPGTMYIVSLIVLQALKSQGITRDDVIAPNTAPTPNGAVRDSKGQIVGVRSFVVL